MQPIAKGLRLSYGSKRCDLLRLKAHVKKIVLRMVFTVSLALLLLTAATAGSVWHHHANTSSESSCVLCHLAHQAGQQTIGGPCVPPMSVISDSAVLADPALRSLAVGPLLATRAPPSL